MAANEYLTVPHLDRKTIARLFSKIRVNPVTGCWEWIGAISGGYGMVRFRGPSAIVHRILYAWTVEPLPLGFTARKYAQLDHVVCNNRRCCNPAHVRLVTQWENGKRSNSPHAIHARASTCVNGHALPPKSGDRRSCVECRAALESTPHRKNWRRINDAHRYDNEKSDPQRYAKRLERSREACRRYRAKRKALHR